MPAFILSPRSSIVGSASSKSRFLQRPSTCPHRSKSKQPSVTPIVGPGSRVPCASTAVVGEDLTLRTDDGVEIGAYLAIPETDKPSDRGVIVMTDILGYKNEETRSVARLVASSGFATIVPDLFRGEPWDEQRPKTEYEMWRAPHDPHRVREDVGVAAKALSERGFGGGLGLIGFCFGGGRLMEEIALSSDGLNPNVAVAFYPTRFDPENVGRNASCPLLFISGDQDELVPADVIDRLQRTISEENGKMESCEMHIVEGAGHAFAHHPQTDEDQIDSEIVLNEACAWLHEHM